MYNIENSNLAKKRNSIHPTAIINWGKVRMGSGNVIGPFVCIGTDAQHIAEKSKGIVQIGNNNTFREYVSVHLPTAASLITSIGDDNYFMSSAHVGHDCKVENKAIVTVGAVLNGHVTVMNGAYIGSGAAIHQFQVIGAYAMLGMNSTVTKTSKILPGGKYAGSPAKRIGTNVVALERNNISKAALDGEMARFQVINLQI